MSLRRKRYRSYFQDVCGEFGGSVEERVGTYEYVYTYAASEQRAMGVEATFRAVTVT